MLLNKGCNETNANKIFLPSKKINRLHKPFKIQYTNSLNKDFVYRTPKGFNKERGKKVKYFYAREEQVCCITRKGL